MLLFLSFESKVVGREIFHLVLDPKLMVKSFDLTCKNQELIKKFYALEREEQIWN